MPLDENRTLSYVSLDVHNKLHEIKLTLISDLFFKKLKGKNVDNNQFFPVILDEINSHYKILVVFEIQVS